jgi:sporulation protein YlmC with PRC-barrel domain
MKRLALAGGVAALMAFGVPALSFADTTLSTTTSGETDAGSLINKKVVDNNNDTVGTVDSVLVNASGKVDAVVLDVSTWLESKKLVSVPWSELKVDSKGNLQTSLTKDAAKQEAAYQYKDQTYRGRVLNENNEIYAPDQAAGSNTTSTNTATDTSTKAGSSGLKNADGSLNASEVIGLKVRNTQNEDVGKISEVLLANNGKADGVIVDVGGILGMGAHPVRLGWKDIKVHANGSDSFASTAMTKDQLKQLPEAKQ